MLENNMKKPLVSIMIRTCQRPDVLNKALESVRNQTYENIQVVVVEDGENKSEELIKEKFSDLNYVYQATEQKVGRSRAGNLALELADGEYLNFLDDDDILLPEHVNKLVHALINGKHMAAYSNAEEVQINITSFTPYKYIVRRKLLRYHQPFNKLLLYTFNYIPIQSIMFHKKLFMESGGFDDRLDALEDWDLWVRFSTKTDFMYVNEITSCYFTPYKRKKKKNRGGDLNKYNEAVYANFENYALNLNVGEINSDMKYIMEEYKEKAYIRYLKILLRRVLWGER